MTREARIASVARAMAVALNKFGGGIDANRFTVAAAALDAADSTNDHVNGVRRGYEDCAVLLDGIGATWGARIKPGHELVEEVLTDVAKHIRMLKVVL